MLLEGWGRDAGAGHLGCLRAVFRYKKTMTAFEYGVQSSRVKGYTYGRSCAFGRILSCPRNLPSAPSTPSLRSGLIDTYTQSNPKLGRREGLDRHHAIILALGYYPRCVALNTYLFIFKDCDGPKTSKDV